MWNEWARWALGNHLPEGSYFAREPIPLKCTLPYHNEPSAQGSTFGKEYVL